MNNVLKRMTLLVRDADGHFVRTAPLRFRDPDRHFFEVSQRLAG